MNGTRSEWTLSEKVARIIWYTSYKLVFRLTFHNWYGLRAAILRRFGAKIGRGVRIRRTVWIEIPWNLEIGDHGIVGDHAILYSLGRIRIGDRSMISQYSHLCAGTHDYDDPSFPLLKTPITIGSDVWVAADAFVGPGVEIGDRAIVAARSTVIKNVSPSEIVGGNPAKRIKMRNPSVSPASVP